MAIAIQTLRDEGVLDVGAVGGTSFVYVITRSRMCFFHAAELPNRRLDEYGAHRAIYWIERGFPSCRVAANLGVTESELRRALLAAGYARTSPVRLAQIAATAHAARKLGNRRGELVRIDAPRAHREAPSVLRAVEVPRRQRNPVFNDKSAATGSFKKTKPAASRMP